MAEPPQKKAKKAKKEKKEKRAAATSENPMLDAYREIVARWPRDMRHLLSASVEPERRAALWEMMSEPGDALRRRYAWAIPDERALRVLAHYGANGIVEIGAGKGYWASLLRARGVDAVAYDAKPPPSTFVKVKRGGPEKLAAHADRALFLCYPDDECQADLDDGEDSPAAPRRGNDGDGDGDDDEEENDDDDEEEAPPSLALACLRAYEGDVVVVVGESVATGTLSLAQAPWGRSCDSLFQVELAASFHPVLVAKLPRWPLSKDAIAVWVRTKVCPVVFERDSDDDDDEDDDGEEGWADIPAEERIDPDCAAPCAAHLLAMPPPR